MNDVRVRLKAACGTVRCEPSWSWHHPADRFVDHDVWFVWAGRGTMRADSATYPLRPGSLFCLRPGQDYAADHDPANRLGVCYLHFDWDGPQKPTGRPPLFVQTVDIEWTERVLRHAVQLRQSGDPLRHDQAGRLVESVLIGMCVEQATPAVSDVQRLHRDAIAAVVRHVRENPGAADTVADLAGRAGYSVDHFTRVFEAVVGQTPKAFCVAVRTERAGQLLRESAMPVGDIARDLGYADVYFFSRQFKQRTGQTPTQWRRATQVT